MVRQKKRNQFSFACIFLVLDRNRLIFFTYIRPKESRPISYNSVYLILARVENFAATDIKCFMFTSQVMNLVITGQCLQFQFHYYAKFLTRVKIHGIVGYSFLNRYEKNHRFLPSIKRDAYKRKLVLFLPHGVDRTTWLGMFSSSQNN